MSTPRWQVTDADWQVFRRATGGADAARRWGVGLSTAVDRLKCLHLAYRHFPGVTQRCIARMGPEQQDEFDAWRDDMIRDGRWPVQGGSLYDIRRGRQIGQEPLSRSTPRAAWSLPPPGLKPARIRLDPPVDDFADTADPADLSDLPSLMQAVDFRRFDLPGKQRVLFATDVHAPFQRSDLLLRAAKLQPTVVIWSDYVDVFGLSRFLQEPEYTEDINRLCLRFFNEDATLAQEFGYHVHALAVEVHLARKMFRFFHRETGALQIAKETNHLLRYRKWCLRQLSEEWRVVLGITKDNSHFSRWLTPLRQEGVKLELVQHHSCRVGNLLSSHFPMWRKIPGGVVREVAQDAILRDASIEAVVQEHLHRAVRLSYYGRELIEAPCLCHEMAYAVQERPMTPAVAGITYADLDDGHVRKVVIEPG